MQDSDKRENIAEENEIPVSGPKPGRHSKASAPAEAIVIEEEEILGDEGDIPLRKKKKRPLHRKRSRRKSGRKQRRPEARFLPCSPRKNSAERRISSKS